MLPLFKTYKHIITVTNIKADVQNLPFNVDLDIKVSENAWKTINKDDAKQLMEIATDNDGSLFLFMAGPLSNILCYQLNILNDKNTYIDIGSVFDDIMGLGKTRKYLKKHTTINKTCVWG